MKKFPRNGNDWNECSWMIQTISISCFIFIPCALGAIAGPALNPTGYLKMNPFVILIPALLLTLYIFTWFLLDKIFVERERE